MDNNQTHPTRIAALGGIEEIGKNMYIIEYRETLVIIDAGVKFASEEMLGVNLIIPSFEYLKANEEKIKALIVTHGHEDHIGCVPFLLREVKVPKIYAARLTLELIKKKLTEHKDVSMPENVLIDDEMIVQIGDFKVDFFTVAHSIPDTYGIAVDTPNGLIVSTADYRFDFTPLGDKTNINKISEIGRRGVTLALAESTNSEKEGFSESELSILAAVKNIFRKTKGRIILSTFASNLGRIEEVVALAVNHGRKVCVLGRSMNTNVEISQKVGYLKIPKDSLIEAREVSNFKDEEVMILSTGSQGEELAALNVMAQGKHAWIHLKPSDVVVLSSNPIPGNVATVEKLINNLVKKGVTVLQNSPFMKLHASGHATKVEQQLMISLLNPKYVMPIHGDYRMLKVQRSSLEEVGIPKENVFICANGDVVEVLNGEAKQSETRLPVDDIYIDDGERTGVSSFVIKDRKTLSEEGMMSVIVVLDKKNNRLVGNPLVISRGSFYTKDSMDLIMRISRRVKSAVEEQLQKSPQNYEGLKNLIKNVAAPLVWKEKKRNPLFIPILIDKLDENQKAKAQSQLRKAEAVQENI